MTTRMGVSRLLCMLAALLIIGNAYSQQSERDRRDQQETRQAQAVSKSVYDVLQKTQEHLESEDFTGALRLLDGLIEAGRLSEYERSRVLQHKGIALYTKGDTDTAIGIFEEILTIENLEPAFRTRTLFTLAQLCTSVGRHERAVELLEIWFARVADPGPDPFIILAQNFYQLGRYNEMIQPVEAAIDTARALGKEIKEDWYVLLNFAYFQEENYAKVRDIHKILLANWPQKQYWLSLAGAYTELGQIDEMIFAYDAAHTAGLLETEAELVTMAQFYMQAHVPYKAAMLLDAEMEAGRVTRSAQNYRLLSQAFTLAQEDERAIPALQQAALLSDDGELDLRLGNAYLNLGRYDECVTAVRSGLEKGGLKSPDNAQISLGMCLYNESEYDAALLAFQEAEKARRSERIARQWIVVIRSEIERDRQIRLVEAQARRLTRKVEERRETAEDI